MPQAGKVRWVKYLTREPLGLVLSAGRKREAPIPRKDKNGERAEKLVLGQDLSANFVNKREAHGYPTMLI